MKKWLVLSDYPQMLDKFVLYGRYMHLLCVCMYVVGYHIWVGLGLAFASMCKECRKVKYKKFCFTCSQRLWSTSALFLECLHLLFRSALS